MSSDYPPVKPLFRESAIKSFNSLEEIRSSIRIIQPAAWIWIIVFTSLFTGIMIWAVFGLINFSIDSEGIILPESYIKESESILHANLKDHQEKIDTLKSLIQNKEKMLKKGYITINDYEQSRSDYESAKKDIVNVPRESYLSSMHPIFSTPASSNTQDMIALVFIDPKEGRNVLPGMEVYLLPSGLSAYEYGYIKGKILSITEYPVSKEIAFSYLPNQNLVDIFFRNGAPFMAKVQMFRSSLTDSGLKWTSVHGPKFAIQSGTMTSTKIIYQKYSPLKLISLMNDL